MRREVKDYFEDIALDFDSYYNIRKRSKNPRDIIAGRYFEELRKYW